MRCICVVLKKMKLVLFCVVLTGKNTVKECEITDIYEKIIQIFPEIKVVNLREKM